MKYTLPKSYANAGLQVEIPDATLKKYRSEAGSTKAAVDRWLYENGFMEKVEYESTVEKAQANKPVKREFKIDKEKAEIVRYLADCLAESKDEFDVQFFKNIEVTNPNRMISFSLGDNKYELTLVRKKQPK